MLILVCLILMLYQNIFTVCAMRHCWDYISFQAGDTLYIIHQSSSECFPWSEKTSQQLYLVLKTVRVQGLICNKINPNFFVHRLCTMKLLSLKSELKTRGFNNIKYINIGGGLGINYKQLVMYNRNLASMELLELTSVAGGG